jgi:hypothetical protein
MPDNEKDKSVLSMADRRKAIREIYSNDESLRILVGRTPAGAARSFFSEESLDRILTQVSSQSGSIDDILRLSHFAYATEPNYAEMIDYLANMYLWRYYYFPVRVKENASGDYGEMYELMTSIIDGVNIENTFPTVLTKLFKEGVVYLYADKNTPSKTISTFILNPKYCAPVMMSQYGTGIYQFDTKYFDSFGLSEEQMNEILELFPDELTSAYRAYKGGGPNKVVIDGRFGSFIQLNEFNFPKKLNTLKSIFDYNTYRKNEVEKNTTELDKILVHNIPVYEDRIIFELPEVEELHKSMAKIISKNKRLKLLTTFGKSEILDLQKPASIQSDTLTKAYLAIFQNSGLNANLFSGASKEALDVSLTRDASVVWKYVQQLLNFYNLTINNLYNFKGFQLELVMTPITHYNQNKMMELYRRNSEFGVGKIELIVASGTKQKHIQPQAELEDFLKLDEILKPLTSSHTRSKEDEQTNKEEVKEEEPKKDEEQDDDDAKE